MEAFLASALESRDRKERAPWEGVVRDYGTLFREVRQLRKRVTHQERQIVLLEHHEGGRERAGSQRLLEQRTQEVHTLRQQLNDAQTQLVTALRTESEASQDRLRLREEAERLRAEAELLRTSTREAVRAREEQQSRMERLERENELLRGEVEQIRTALSRAEEEKGSIRREFEEFRQITRRTKGQWAEQLNELTDQVERQRRELESLRGGAGALHVSAGAGEGGRERTESSGTDSPWGDVEAAALPVPAQTCPSLLTVELPEAHTSAINGVCFNESDSLLATCDAEGHVKLWDPITGHETGEVAVTGGSSHSLMSVHVLRTSLVTGGMDRTVYHFDITTGRIRKSFHEHRGPVFGCQFTPDGRRIVSGASDRTVKVWDVSSGRCARTISCKSAVRSCCVSGDGIFVVTGHMDNSVRLFDVRNGQCLADRDDLHTSPVTSAEFSQGDGGSRVLTAGRDNVCRVLDGRTLDPLPWAHRPRGDEDAPAVAVFQHPEFESAFLWTRAALSPTLGGSRGDSGSGFVAVGGKSGAVVVWRAESGKAESVLRGVVGQVSAVEWSRDARKLVAVDDRGGLYLWN